MADVELYIGKVVSGRAPFIGEKDDEYKTGAILVRIPKDDFEKVQVDKLPPCLPLLPKMIHVKPKVNEQVLCVVQNNSRAGEQRYYLGPIISQPQKIEGEFDFSGTKFHAGGFGKPLKNPDNFQNSEGALPKDTDIALIGRNDCDIILSEDEMRIRCGVRLIEKDQIVFNRASPAYIKMKYYKKPMWQNTTEQISSTATIVADRINLISPSGDFQSTINLNDTNEGIDDDNMMRLIESAHRLPYGDFLCDFLAQFMQVFLAHSHNGNNKPPTPEPMLTAFTAKYQPNKQALEKKLLSEVIRVN